MDKVESPYREMVKPFVTGEKINALLFGVSGAGKTFVGVACLREIYDRAKCKSYPVESGRPICRIVHFNELCNFIRDKRSFDRSIRETAEIEMKRCRLSQILLVNEFGVDDPKIKADILQFFDERWASFRPTIVTTSKQIDDLKAVDGGPVILTRLCSGVVVQFDQKRPGTE